MAIEVNDFGVNKCAILNFCNMTYTRGNFQPNINLLLFCYGYLM